MSRLNTIKWLIKISSYKRVVLLLILMSGGIVSILSVVKAFISKYLIDEAISGSKNTMLIWLVLLGVTILVDMLLSAYRRLISDKVKEQLSIKLQKELFSHIINAEFLIAKRRHSVEYMTKLTNDIDSVVKLIVLTLPDLFSFIVMLLASFVALLSIDRSMALVAVSVFPICLLGGKYYAKKQKKYYTEIENTEIERRTLILESIKNMLIVKVFCQEENIIDKISVSQNKSFNLKMKKTYHNIITNLIIQSGVWCSYFIIFLWGAYHLYKGSNAFGSLTALTQLFGCIQAPFWGLAQSLPILVNSIAASERLISIYKMPLDKLNEDGLPLNSNDIGIKISNLQYRYGQQRALIEHLSIHISSGEMVAIIGNSGTGKTTLAHIIMSLIEPQGGCIQFEIDGCFYQQSKQMRKNISYIPQRDAIFSGSIKENLLFGNPTASDSEIKEALKNAEAYAFISELKDGIHTIIGENGNGLSQGQLQRISIARAFLKKKAIIILDEATSALDSKTEKIILNNLKSMQHKPTCLFITHKPAALKYCTQVLDFNENKRFSKLVVKSN